MILVDSSGVVLICSAATLGPIPTGRCTLLGTVPLDSIGGTGSNLLAQSVFGGTIDLFTDTTTGNVYACSTVFGTSGAPSGKCAKIGMVNRLVVINDCGNYNTPPCNTLYTSANGDLISFDFEGRKYTVLTTGTPASWPIT
jgi:hypothetical protein